MKTLADAWSWYQATKRNLARLRRLGEKHWTDPSLADATLWQDDYFRMLEASDIVAETRISLEPIDELAVVVLFSVFESTSRRIPSENDRISQTWTVWNPSQRVRGGTCEGRR